MELFKTVLLFVGIILAGIVGLALVMTALSIPIWGAIWLVGEIIKA